MRNGGGEPAPIGRFVVQLSAAEPRQRVGNAEAYRPPDTLICRAGLFLRLSHPSLQSKHVGNHDAGGGKEDQR